MPARDPTTGRFLKGSGGGASAGGGTEVERLVVRLTGDGTAFQKMLAVAQQSVKSAAGVIERAGKQLEAVRKRIESVGRAFRSAAASMASIGRSMMLKITLPINLAAGASVKAFAGFDQAMTESTSIMAVTEQQTKKMRDIALSLSGEAAQSPKDLARSYFFLASAGLDAEQSMAALPQVAKFATAGAFDMATATDLLTDAQSALGLTSKDAAVNLQNMTRLSDVLVKANTLANASVQQFSESLTNTAGASLRAFNKDAEEGMALLAAYADQGVKGAVAGTNLSRVMLLLSKSSRDSAKAHKALGFSVFDTQGKMRNFADLVENLENVTRGMSDETKAATLEQLGFEARIQQAILPLLGTSKSIRRYETELRKAAGTTQQVADKQMKSFTNQMKLLWNQITAVGIEIGEMLVPAIMKISELIKRGIAIWKGFSDEQKKMIIVVAGIAAAIGPVLIGFAGFLSVIGLAASGLAALLSPVALVTAAIAALGATTIIRLAGTKGVMEWFVNRWKDLAAFVKPAIDGIVNALKAGDIELAMKIAVKQMEIAWVMGLIPLQEAWNDFTVYFLEVWEGTSDAILKYWRNTITSLAATWLWLEDWNDKQKLKMERWNDEQKMKMWGWTGMSKETILGGARTDRDILGRDPIDIKGSLQMLESDLKKFNEDVDRTSAKALNTARDTAGKNINSLKDQLKMLQEQQNKMLKDAEVGAAIATGLGFIKKQWGVVSNFVKSKLGIGPAVPGIPGLGDIDTGVGVAEKAIASREAATRGSLEARSRVHEFTSGLKTSQRRDEKNERNIEKIEDNTKMAKTALEAILTAIQAGPKLAVASFLGK